MISCVLVLLCPHVASCLFCSDKLKVHVYRARKTLGQIVYCVRKTLGQINEERHVNNMNSQTAKMQHFMMLKYSRNWIGLL